MSALAAIISRAGAAGRCDGDAAAMPDPNVPTVLTRQEARESGARRYFTGKSCIRGHLSERRTKDGGCLACTAARRQRDPEGTARHVAAYLARNRENRNLKQRENRAENPEAALSYEKKWRDANRLAMRAAAARRYRENGEKIRAAARVKTAKRRAATRQGYTVSDVQILLARQRRRCAACAVNVRKNYHVDHIVPLARGGSNGPKNIQILCPHCNLSKGARDPIEFARQLGRLL